MGVKKRGKRGTWYAGHPARLLEEALVSFGIYNPFGVLDPIAELMNKACECEIGDGKM